MEFVQQARGEHLLQHSAETLRAGSLLRASWAHTRGSLAAVLEREYMPGKHVHRVYEYGNRCKLS